MKRKIIEQIPWQSCGEKEKMIVVASVHKIGGEDVLIVDFSLDKPVARIALSHSDFENYIPDESPCENLPRWGRRQYDDFRHGNGFYIPYNSYHTWETLAEGKTADIIHQFVYGKDDPFHTDWNHDISYLQFEILREKNDQAEFRRNDRIRKKMSAVPEPTDGFRRWAMKFVDKHVMYMIPFRKKKTTKATCSACQYEQEYEKGRIKPKQRMICPSCGAECTVKRVDYENNNPISGYEFGKEVLLFQKIGEEFCQRHFYVSRRVDFSGEKERMTEIGRIFYPAGRFVPNWNGDMPQGLRNKEHKYYHKYDPWENKTFWDDKNLYGMSNITLGPGPVYPRTVNKQMFKGTKYQYCVMELVKNEKEFEPIEYLKKFEMMPQMVEMMVKTGLRRLAFDISPYEFKGDGKPWEQLGITKKQMKRLRNINGGVVSLKWMRYEDGVGRIIDNETLRYFERERIVPEDIEFISDRMTEQRIKNYIIRQCKQQNVQVNDILILWRDYLSMALRMKMDVQKELIFKPKDLKLAHDDLVKLCGGADVAKRAGEIIQKYPDVDEILLSIKDKYEFMDDRYAVVVPEKIEDIIYEGRKLGHCLDKSDIYFDRIQRRESFIVFLRKTEDIEKPYYTMEIEPDGTTRQKRTTGDRQDKDFQAAVSFIQKWQRKVKKRLNCTDKKLAAQSAELRKKEFEELRKNQTKVWHGALAGKLLVEVLEADLMIANEQEDNLRGSEAYEPV